jgi:ABC-type sugar transport system permease subunit
MALGDNLPAVGAVSLVGAYLLQRTVFEETTFRSIYFYTFLVTLFIQSFYSIIIWPLLLSPVRHLPKVPVRILIHGVEIHTNKTRALQATLL